MRMKQGAAVLHGVYTAVGNAVHVLYSMGCMRACTAGGVIQRIQRSECQSRLTTAQKSTRMHACDATGGWSVCTHGNLPRKACMRGARQS